MASTQQYEKDQERNRKFGLAALLGIVLYFLFGKSKTKNIEVTADFVLEGYRDLVQSDSDFNYEGVPLHIYLAQHTTNYDAVKLAYKNAYDGASLTKDLQKRLAGTKFAEYVNTLWDTNRQAMTE